MLLDRIATENRFHAMVATVPMELCCATSFDCDHPPTNTLESNNTFWVTTGLFPQEIVDQFKKPAQITRITTTTGKVRSMIVYAALDKAFTDWDEIDGINLPAQPISQHETHQLNYQRTSWGIKIVITTGWGPFVALYHVCVEGPTVNADEEAAPAKPQREVS
jgi:heat shock protein beta-11